MIWGVGFLVYLLVIGLGVRVLQRHGVAARDRRELGCRGEDQ